MKFNYSLNEIVQALKKLEIKTGDNIFLHSNIGFFGRLEGAENERDYYNQFKEAIFTVIGKEGTMVVPTFSYSFCRKSIYDAKETPGVCGLFSEMVRKDLDSLRSEDANFSVAAIGKNSKYFTENPPEYSFGKGSFWEKFLKMDGKFLNLNFDAGSTFIHYVESTISVPYRYYKPFNGVSIIDGREESRTFYHFVYDYEKPYDAPDFTKFDKKAKELGIAKVQNLGRGQIVRITAADSFNLIKKEFETNHTFLTKGNCKEESVL